MTTLWLALLILTLDQAAKNMAISRLALGQSVAVIPGFFDLTHVRNTGAVWGSFQNQNVWLTLFSCVALLAMALFYCRVAGESKAQRVALGLMLGGIFGNLADRIRWGWVVDFLDFYWRNFHWPAFNLADAAILLGVIAYLLASFRQPTGDGRSTP